MTITCLSVIFGVLITISYVRHILTEPLSRTRQREGEGRGWGGRQKESGKYEQT